ncbi:MAG TPA: poly(3-hydroxybutyrate) depolymerase [Azonexus sp.]|nr:poly(3-hydroxybutyrate) depolymerase [Azonexus sp.]
MTPIFQYALPLAAALTLAGAAPQAIAAPELPALSADRQGLTVSGISSGGYMAVQFQVAHSKLVHGAGVLAGGPYYCAEGSTWRALSNCMSPSSWTPLPPLVQLKSEIETLSRMGRIDPLENLRDDRVWLLSGGKDHTVETPVMDTLVALYREWLPAEAIRYVKVADAGHAMISTADPKPNACATSEPPFINRCGDLDAAGELLKHLLGPAPLQAPAKPPGGEIISFDQRPFVAGKPIDASLADEGYAYVPQACRQGACRVHVAFHGCRQSVAQIGRRFVEGAGYNAWADSNHLIVLYPQTVPRNGFASGSWKWVYNPKGCWDWWGYSGTDYHTRDGVQIKAVQAMIERLGVAPKAEPR